MSLQSGSHSSATLWLLLLYWKLPEKPISTCIYVKSSPLVWTSLHSGLGFAMLPLLVYFLLPFLPSSLAPFFLLFFLPHPEAGVPRKGVLSSPFFPQYILHTITAQKTTCLNEMTDFESQKVWIQTWVTQCRYLGLTRHLLNVNNTTYVAVECLKFFLELNIIVPIKWLDMV